MKPCIMRLIIIVRIKTGDNIIIRAIDINLLINLFSFITHYSFNDLVNEYT